MSAPLNERLDHSLKYQRPAHPQGLCPRGEHVKVHRAGPGGPSPNRYICDTIPVPQAQEISQKIESGKILRARISGSLLWDCLLEMTRQLHSSWFNTMPVNKTWTVTAPTREISWVPPSLRTKTTNACWNGENISLHHTHKQHQMNSTICVYIFVYIYTYT